MALVFQYNKTYLQKLERELKIRLQALPTLVAKETALRLEVHKIKLRVQEIEEQLREKTAWAATLDRFWVEISDQMVRIARVVVLTDKIAGVAVHRLERVEFEIQPYSVFNAPAWIPEGIEVMKTLIELRLAREFALRNVKTLEFARRKTTQKVNLYEKVQIPEYQEAMLKIKRFLEDEDNLAKASQKILKARLAQAEMAA